MKEYFIYLAGPISGLTYKECTEWREYFYKTIDESTIKHVTCLDPMRGKTVLQQEQSIQSTGYQDILCKNRSITTRDRFDVMRSDLIVVNFLGAKRVSIGSVMEIAWADMLRKPIILIMEGSGNLHDHGMITEAVGFRVSTVKEAIKVAKSILGV